MSSVAVVYPFGRKENFIFSHWIFAFNEKYDGSRQQRRYSIQGRPTMRITQVTNDSREKAFLYQRLSVVIQRYNAVILDGFAHTSHEDEF